MKRTYDARRNDRRIRKKKKKTDDGASPPFFFKVRRDASRLTRSHDSHRTNELSRRGGGEEGEKTLCPPDALPFRSDPEAVPAPPDRTPGTRRRARRRCREFSVSATRRDATRTDTTAARLSLPRGTPATLCVMRRDICCPSRTTPLRRARAHSRRVTDAFSLFPASGSLRLAPRTRDTQGGTRERVYPPVSHRVPVARVNERERMFFYMYRL